MKKISLLFLFVIHIVQTFNELLDPTFGTTTPLAGFSAPLLLSSQGFPVGTVPFMLLADDTKLVVALSTNQGNAIARYTSLGLLDSQTFNRTGVVPGVTNLVMINNFSQGTTQPIFTPLNSPQLAIVTGAYRMLGSIVNTAGIGFLAGIQWRAGTANNAGTLDSSFGSRTNIFGRIESVTSTPGTTLFQLNNSTSNTTITLSDDKSIFAGTNQPFSYNSAGASASQALLAKMTANGFPDLTFNSGFLPITISDDATIGLDVCLTPTNKLALLGFDSTTQRFIVARALSQGILDVTFGDRGAASLTTGAVGNITVPLGNYENHIVSLSQAIIADSSLIVVGQFYNTHNGISTGQPLIVKLTPSGTLDPLFSSNFVVPDSANTIIRKVLLVATLPGGVPDIIFVGTSTNATTKVIAPFVARVNGITGIMQWLTQLPFILNGNATSDSTVAQAIIDPNGDILVAGSTAVRQGPAYGYVARINNDGSLDFTFNLRTTTNQSWFLLLAYPQANATQINDMILQSDGKPVLAIQMTTSEQFDKTFGVPQTMLARVITT